MNVLPMLDHISFGVSDLARSIAFYDAILSPLGFARVWTSADAAGYGYPDQDESFAIKQESNIIGPGNPREHLAFNAATREAAMEFHAAGIRRGAIDEGAPALCPEYGENYFAAFLRDADGHRLEAVCHLSQPRERQFSNLRTTAGASAPAVCVWTFVVLTSRPRDAPSASSP
jgi:catechol 2,3-dioxygenase-like lactoylglutathione lyase family enzyme